MISPQAKATQTCCIIVWPHTRPSPLLSTLVFTWSNSTSLQRIPSLLPLLLFGHHSSFWQDPSLLLDLRYTKLHYPNEHTELRSMYLWQEHQRRTCSAGCVRKHLFGGWMGMAAPSPCTSRNSTPRICRSARDFCLVSLTTVRNSETKQRRCKPCWGSNHHARH